MPLSVRSAFLFALAAIACTGCTKQARTNRYLARGEREVDANEYDNAELEYRTALAILPNSASAMGHLGTLYYNEGRILPAYVLLRKAVDRDPNNSVWRLTFALAAFTVERTSEARTAAKRVLESDPRSEDALILLAETSVTSAEANESLAIVERSVRRNKDAAAYRVATGVLLLRARDLKGAEYEYKRALEFDPNSAAAFAELGNLYSMRKDTERAQSAYKRGADLSPLRSPRRIKYIEFLIRSGATDEAIKELNEIARKAPDYFPASIAAMTLAFDQRRYEDSEAAAMMIIRRDPANYDALMQVAHVKLAKGDTDGAIKDLIKLADRYNEEPQAKYELARAYLKNGDKTRAADSLNKALIRFPNYAQAALLLAEINVQEGDSAAAITSLQQLVKREPRNYRAYLLLAKAYRASGNLEQALETFQRLNNEAPQAPEGHYLEGMVLIEMGQREDARVSFEKSIQLTKDYWPALEMLVDMDLAANRTSAAINRVSELIRQFPTRATPWLLRAKIRVAGHDEDGAQSDLLKAIDLDPTSQYAYLQLARLYLHNNQAQQALEKLTALASKTSSVNAQMQLGMVHTALKQYDAARDDYERLLAIDPAFVPALNNLAFLYSENLGQSDKGLAMATRAKRLDSNNLFVEDTLGWILLRRGDYDGARPLLEDVADKSPGNPEVQYHVAMVRYMLGQEEPAQRAFQNATLGDLPAKEDALYRLAILKIDPAIAGAEDRATLENQVRREPNDPIARVRLAAIEERSGEAKEASANFEAALKLTPRSAPIMTELAQIYFGPLKNPGRARELAKTAHELAPNDANVSWTLGRVLYHNGEYAWSSDLLQAASRGLSNQPELLFDLAQVYYGMGHVPEAEAELQRLSDSGAAYADSGKAQRMASMIGAAKSPALAMASLSDAHRILSTEPDYIPALMVSALAQEQQGDYTGAARIYEKVLGGDPVFASATRRLAILYAERLGDDKKAEDLATKARLTFPDDPDLAFDLGILNYRRSDYNEAVRFLQQSLDKRPESGATVYYLGLCHYRLKNAVAAKEELRRSLEMNLSEQDADDAKRVLEELDTMDSIGSS